MRAVPHGQAGIRDQASFLSTYTSNHYDDVGDETFLKLVARMGYGNAYRHESDDSDNDFNEAANTQTD